MNRNYKLLEEAYKLCLYKVQKHMECLQPHDLYEYIECIDGRYEQGKRGLKLEEKDNWLTSFVTGLAPLCYRTEKREAYLIWANKCRKAYHDKIFHTPLESMHDIGFLYIPYSLAMYQITGDLGHREDALKAADELLKRFDIKGQFIDAWGRMDDDGREARAIIDCMMNIQLLFWAWKETGHTIYRDVAKAHMDTTIRYFIREDLSVCHSFLFDRKTGAMVCESNTCGYENGSYWARGCAWMVYGLAMAARYLEDFHYHELAVKLTDKYLDQLNGSNVPIWDFRLPSDKPAATNHFTYTEPWDEADSANCIYNVDTSASAIIACAMIEMDKFARDKRYAKTVEDTLCELGEFYFDRDPQVLGMLTHQNGRMHYTVYGDYFFVQALQQYLYDTKTCW